MQMDTMLKPVVIACAAVFVVTMFLRDRYPPPGAVLEDLFEDPIQTKVDKPEFSFDKGGRTYTIEPLYEYELWGVVVSHHTAKSWFNVYHKRWGDDLNVKDVCVVWGENIKTDSYRRIKFRSGSWMCNWRTYDEAAFRLFRNNAASNNHLLINDRDIKRTVMRVRRGDQIRVKGYLANYSHDQGFNRGTSVTREDTGVGACETIFVKEFEILKASYPTLDILHNSAKYIGLVALVFWGIAAWKKL